MSKKITKKQVQKTAELARVELTKENENQFAKELGDILDFFANIQKIQSKNAKKFDHYQLSRNQLRSDKVEGKTDELVDDIEHNFPQREKGHLKVKNTISN